MCHKKILLSQKVEAKISCSGIGRLDIDSLEAAKTNGNLASGPVRIHRDLDRIEASCFGGRRCVAETNLDSSLVPESICEPDPLEVRFRQVAASG